MSTSVVVCAYTMDRWDDLREAVESCFAQSAPPDQVIVVIDYNDELLVRAKLELTGALVLANRSVKGLSGARNTGVALSSGDVVVFLDDDAYADEGWLAALEEAFRDDRVVGVGGWVVPRWPAMAPPWFPKSFYWVLGCSYLGLPGNNATIRNPIGANMAIRRRVFDRVGGFTNGIGRIGQNQLGCEETELCIRYGAVATGERFVLRRDAVVHHRVPSARLTWHYFWKRCWAEGISKAAVTSLAGAERGLAAERAHAAKTLPAEAWDALVSAARTPRTSLSRLALIVAGTALALAGLGWGTFRLRSHALTPDHGGLDALRNDDHPSPKPSPTSE